MKKYLILMLLSINSCHFLNAQPQSEPFKGIVLNSCGPTDAHVVRLILAQNDISCEANHQDFEHISAYLESGEVSQMKSGMKIEGHSPANSCQKNFENCSSIGKIKLHISGETNDMLKGSWESESGKAGAFQVKKCSNKRDLCG